MKYMRSIARHPAAFPILLLLTLLAVYGYQLSRMGFYWDDWQLVYLASLKDPQVFWGYYAFDRPLAAWLYVALTPILGINPVAWQIFAILARWIGCLGFWVLMKQIWPQRVLEAGFATLLMAVFPGFSQQPVSMTYSLFWVLYALFTWSLAASVIALKKPRYAVGLTILAVLASFMEALSMEYVIGLELLRPALFLIILLQLNIPLKKAIRQVLVKWIPYFLVLCAFFYYRFIYFPQSNTDPEANAPLLLREILTQPLIAIPHLLQNILQDISQALIFAWGKPILPAEIDFAQTTNWFAYAMGLLLAALTVLILCSASLSTNNGKQESGNDHFTFQAVLVGLAGVILGGLPVWSTNRQIIVGMWSDRFSLGLMLGAVILLAGIAGWLSQKSVQKAVFLGVFLALGIAFQIQNTAKYKLNWDAQKDYYNQLAWRAPELKAGTAILGNRVPFGLSAEYSTGFALNTIYTAQPAANLPFWFFSAVSDRGGSIPDYREGIPLKFSLRTINYESSTSNGVAVYYKYGQSCLRVMTPADKHFPNLDDSESELLAISHPGNILEGKRDWVLPEEIFGSELSHGWCYYFQKADLARQSGNWKGVLDVYHQAESARLAPRNGTEYVPVIQALAHNGEWEQAWQLTTQGVSLTGSAKPYFCDIWNVLRDLDGDESVYQKVSGEMDCGES
jgi:hypothetical protein